MNKQGKKANMALWAILVVVVIVGGFVVYSLMGKGVAPVQQSVVPITTTGGNTVATTVPAGCSQNPTYSYSAVDKLTSTPITGVDEIKMNDNAPVSTLTNPTAGTNLQYWKENSTYYCEVTPSSLVQCSSQNIQTKCYQDTTPSLKVYDLDNALFLTLGGGVNNLTVGANEVHNLKLTYQGVAFKSDMPFGGCIAVEVPNTFSSVTMPGYSACPYKWTYSNQAGNTYYMFAVPKGFDINGAGDLKELPFSIKSGNSDPSGSAIITIQPANNYVGNDGSFHLGVEKDFNSDTTKTAVATSINVTIA